MHDRADELLTEFAEMVDRMVVERGLDNSALERSTGYDRRNFGRARTGKKLPSASLARLLDRELGTGTAVQDMRARVWAAQQLERFRSTGCAEEPDRATVDIGISGEVDPTNRRGALRLMAVAPAAAELSRRIATADPDPLSLDRFETAVQRVAVAYRVTPHSELLAALVPAWNEVEQILDTRVSARVRGRLTLVAGQYAFYVGTAGFDTGDDELALACLRIANQHAQEAADLLSATSHLRSNISLLEGSVAAIRSSVAYFAGDHVQAAALAAIGRDKAHPYTRPILAGCEARSAAVAKQPDVAQAALDDMLDNVWEGEVLPGPNPGNEPFAQGFLAATLAQLGRGDQAEPHAQRALDLELSTNHGHFVQVGGKWTTLGRAFLQRPDPDPEQAAHAARQALRVVEERPTRTVVQTSTELWRRMNRRWPELPAVRDLGELASHSARALPPSPSAV